LEDSTISLLGANDEHSKVDSSEKSENVSPHDLDEAHKERMIQTLRERAGKKQDLWTGKPPDNQLPPPPSPPKVNATTRTARTPAQSPIVDAFGQQSFGSITTSVRNSAGHSVSYEVPDDPPAQPTNARMSGLEREIVRVIGGAQLPAKAIASRLGQANSSHLRTILANLVERGVLLKRPEGYCIPQPTEP
jgi:hypothetical protein